MLFSLTRDPSNYRLRFLSDVAHTFVVPVLILHLVFWLRDISLPRSRLIPLDFAFIVGWSIAKIRLRNVRQNREARSLNARQIPRVIGKWPGNIDVLLTMMQAFKTSYVADVYLQLFIEHQCTTLNLRLLWQDTIITMDQEHAKFVLATGFQRFWRGRSQKERLETFLGTGIFNRDDEVWKMHRTTARPFFAHDRIRDFQIFEKYTAHTLSILSTNAASHTPCEVQDLYARFTLDAASEFLFGKNLDTLSLPFPVAGDATMGVGGSAMEGTWGDFAEAFESCQQNATIRARIGQNWPLFELLKDKNQRHAKVIHDWLDPLVRKAIDDRLGAHKAGVEIPIPEKTFLQHLADTTDDPIVIRDQLLSMLLASRDTTACVLTYITYLMALHPDVAQKLRAEVLEHCGPTAPGTFDSFRNMKYMRAVINETLRLFPPVPINARECRREGCVLPPSDPTFPVADNRPLYMPANTVIMYFPLLTQRNQALWGEDADEFDPERWIQPERLKKFVSNPAMFTPFSAGPRICIGQNYAYNEMSYFLVRLLQQFDRFSLSQEYQPQESLPPPEWKSPGRNGRQTFEKVWPAAAMTLYVKGGVWVKFHRAK